ncbi:carbon-nitrogen hydrolase family protein [Pacificibacter sp. AS14]|uniref:carbon-nitrogen hydrolase family protein n=1 Tax=Pacificibacter sp. AS14 TaxID=3135785 RepID=UPI00316E50E2
MPKVGLITLNSSDDPAQNLREVQSYIDDAVTRGAQIVMTPEVTNCVSTSRTHQQSVLCLEADDATLQALQKQALKLRVWILIGSLALRTGDADGRFANRSFLIGPDGRIKARYDKIHMFDVTLSDTESYKESAGYRPGTEAIMAQTDIGSIGLTICYDVRFPHIYRALAQAGAEILTVPAAFAQATGRAHWEVLLRARAIETGSFVFAPAQTGQHSEAKGGKRKTHGHSLAISPWGEVLYDGGTECGVGIVDYDLNDVAKARSAIPSLQHDRAFKAPK